MSVKIDIIFVAINFILFLGFVSLMFKSIAREFFFARRERIKREIAQAAWKLRRAKKYYNDVCKNYGGLSDDIETRIKAIAKDCKKECEQILNAAEYHRDYVIMGARRIAQEEEKEAARLLKKRIVRAAMQKVVKKFYSEGPEEIENSVIEEGLFNLKSELRNGNLDIGITAI